MWHRESHGNDYSNSRIKPTSSQTGLNMTQHHDCGSDKGGQPVRIKGDKNTKFQAVIIGKLKSFT